MVTAMQPQLPQTRQLYSCGPNTLSNAIDAMFSGKNGKIMGPVEVDMSAYTVSKEHKKDCSQKNISFLFNCCL